MVLDATTFTPWTRGELLRRFPFLVSGAEGEGEGGGEGSGTQDPPGGEGTGSSTTTQSGEGGEGKNEPEVFPREYVETLRSENASRRQREKDLEAELQKFKEAEKEREKAEMTEAERAKTEAEEAKAQAEAANQALLDERKRNALMAQASKLKFRDPEDALAYIDLESVKMNDDGTPHKASVESAVKRVADEKKYLIEGPGSADGGTTGSPPKPDAEREKEIQDDITARGGVPVRV